MMWLAAYPEIHYRVPGLFSYYYRKEPEIVFDCSARLVRGRPFKIALFIKDAHQFPITLKQIEIKINDQTVWQKSYQQFIDAPFFQEIITIDVDAKGKTFHVVPSLTFQQKKRTKTIFFHNFALIKAPLRIHSMEPKVRPAEWLVGDLHYHSWYTADQVEFGAPLKMTRELAQNAGLDWIAVTDHSYDLDDAVDNYLQNDPNLPKWKALQQEIQAESRPDFTFLLGEEISAGNHLGQNVHLLNLCDTQFFPGSGDSAEKWFCNHPELSIEDIRQQSNGLLVAAHPFSKVPWLQKLTLRRGSWEEFDLAHVSHLQIANGDGQDFHRNRAIWLHYLQKGYRLIPLAGNDAHGNFYAFRQIHIPMLRLVERFHQIPGLFQTGVFEFANKDAAILAAIKQGKTCITTGPFIRLRKNFELEWESNESQGKAKYLRITTNIESIDIQMDDFYKRITIEEYLPPLWQFAFVELVTEKRYYAMSNILFRDRDFK